MTCKQCFFAAGHVNDGCHPTDYGYERIAEVVYALLVRQGILTGRTPAAAEVSTTSSMTATTLPSTATTITITTALPSTATTTTTLPTTLTTTSTKTRDVLDALMQP